MQRVILVSLLSPSKNDVTIKTRGVKNYWKTGTGTGKPEIGDPVPVPVWKIQKPGTPVHRVIGNRVPRFTELLGTGVFMLFNNIYILI